MPLQIAGVEWRSRRLKERWATGFKLGKRVDAEGPASLPRRGAMDEQRSARDVWRVSIVGVEIE